MRIKPSPTSLNTVKRALKSAVLLALCMCVLVTNATTYAAASEDERLINLGLPYLSYSSTLCNSSGATSSLDDFLKALALHESGGNPAAANPGSSASGKYQYISSTWLARADIYGPANQYATAAAAPEAVQDAVAYIEYAKKFAQLDGDVEKLAISHFYPAVLGSPDRWDEIAPGANGGKTYRDYITEMTNKIGTPEAQAIPLLYAQAPDFQSWLTKSGADVSGNTASSSGCSAGIPAGDFVLYYQFDDRWATHPYGDRTIRAAGCGPTSLAMIVATFKDKSVTPITTADWAAENNHDIPGSGGSRWSLFTEGPAHWGLKSEEIFASPSKTSNPSSADMDAATQVLKNGGLVIASGTGAVPFTSEGHILVIRGIDENGRVLVGDPGHGDGTNPNPNKISYAWSDLAPYMYGLWGITK